MPHPEQHLIDDYVTATLMRDLVGHDRRPVSFLVYLWLAAEQQRRHAAVLISYQELAESIGVSKSAAQSAVAWLMRRKLLASTKPTVTATPTYIVQTPWNSRVANKSTPGPKPIDSAGFCGTDKSVPLSKNELFQEALGTR